MSSVPTSRPLPSEFSHPALQELLLRIRELRGGGGRESEEDRREDGARDHLPGSIENPLTGMRWKR